MATGSCGYYRLGVTVYRLGVTPDRLFVTPAVCLSLLGKPDIPKPSTGKAFRDNALA